MSEVIFNIYGGTQQVNPNATTAAQNFYGDRFAADLLKGKTPGGPGMPAEADMFAVYINNVEDMPRYLSMLSGCATATELAQVVMTLLEAEPKITAEEVVKERFIARLLPLAPNITKGTGVDNIRARINDALAKRPKKTDISSSGDELMLKCQRTYVHRPMNLCSLKEAHSRF